MALAQSIATRLSVDLSNKDFFFLHEENRILFVRGRLSPRKSDFLESGFVKSCLTTGNPYNARAYICISRIEMFKV